MDRIGYGGLGVVYRADHRKSKRQVAIKILHAELLEVETAQARFFHEAEVAARLEHPNIIPVYAVGLEAGIAYIVMHLINGESLAAALDREGRVSPTEARRILIEVADALDCMHALGFVHLNIKPQKIMLDGPARRVVLMGFGNAMRLATNDFSTSTGAGVATGTPPYMSPEQAAGDNVDGRSDIYSLGVVGYQLLSGSPPFDGSTPQDIPLDLAAVVMRCLAKQPAERWNRAADLSSALKA